jgi:hypothetical protein
MNHTGHQIVKKPRSALSTAAFGLSAFTVTVVVCATSIILYGLYIVDRKSDGLVDLLESSIVSLPEVAEALPPAISDVLRDRRAPDYAEQLDVSVRLAEVAGREGVTQPVIEVQNRGHRLVTLLSMRIVILDEDGRPAVESNEWAATPFAADDDWRGPLMPGSTRKLSGGYYRLGDGRGIPGDRVSVEITDIRVWAGETPASPALSAADVTSSLPLTGL